jgi:hypothetical protein
MATVTNDDERLADRLCVECAIPGKHSRDIAQAISDARERYRRQVAAYLLDRADQCVTQSASWVGLADAAHAVINGEVEERQRVGELDDPELLARVDGFAARRAP